MWPEMNGSQLELRIEELENRAEDSIADNHKTGYHDQEYRMFESCGNSL